MGLVSVHSLLPISSELVAGPGVIAVAGADAVSSPVGRVEVLPWDVLRCQVLRDVLRHPDHLLGCWVLPWDGPFGAQAALGRCLSQVSQALPL